MKRRLFLAGVGALTATLVHGLVSGAKRWRIAIIGRISAEADKTFTDSLTQSDYVEGRDFVIEQHSYDGTPQGAAEAVAKAIAGSPELIVSWGTLATVTVKRTGTTLPVIFLSVGVPVEIGLISSLSRPGTNMTGVTFEATTETYAKRLQLLKEVVPRMARVAVLHATGDANVPHALESLDQARHSLGVTMQSVAVTRADELESAFLAIRRYSAHGLIVVAGALTYVNRQKIADLALSSALPSCHAFRETVVAGGLISLGPNYTEMARQGAAYVVKILRGTNPAEMAVGAADEDGSARQPENRPCPGPHHPTVAAGPSGSGHRISRGVPAPLRPSRVPHPHDADPHLGTGGMAAGENELIRSRKLRRKLARAGSSPMPTYISLLNFTQKGAETIKDGPKRLELRSRDSRTRCRDKGVVSRDGPGMTPSQSSMRRTTRSWRSWHSRPGDGKRADADVSRLQRGGLPKDRYVAVIIARAAADDCRQFTWSGTRGGLL